MGQMGPMGPRPNWAKWAQRVPGPTGPNGPNGSQAQCTIWDFAACVTFRILPVRLHAKSKRTPAYGGLHHSCPSSPSCRQGWCDKMRTPHIKSNFPAKTEFSRFYEIWMFGYAENVPMHIIRFQFSNLKFGKFDHKCLNICQNPSFHPYIKMTNGYVQNVRTDIKKLQFVDCISWIL